MKIETCLWDLVSLAPVHLSLLFLEKGFKEVKLTIQSSDSAGIYNCPNSFCYFSWKVGIVYMWSQACKKRFFLRLYPCTCLDIKNSKNSWK